jgi:glucan biosynthesis protein C
LDALRAFLMLVGLPFHAARLFRGDLPALDTAAEFTSVWRMTTFFVVAGFFALLVAQRRGPWVWLRGRVVRLGVPLVFCVLVLNPWQSIMFWGEDVALRRLTHSAWPWLHHAWFLLYLLIYCALFAAAFAVFRGLLTGGLGVLARGVFASGWTLAGCALLGGLAAYAIHGLWLEFGVGDATRRALTHLLGIHVVSFGAGLLMAAGSNHADRIPTLARGPVVVVAVLGTLWVLVEPAPAESDAAKAAYTGVAMTAGLAWAALWMRWFARHCNRDTMVVRWLVSASLPVYLLHHVVAFGLGPVVADQGWNPWVGFAVLTVLVCVIAFVGYEVANLTTPTRLLLSGDRSRGVSLYDVLRARREPPLPSGEPIVTHASRRP